MSLQDAFPASVNATRVGLLLYAHHWTQRDPTALYVLYMFSSRMKITLSDASLHTPRSRVLSVANERTAFTGVTIHSSSH